VDLAVAEREGHAPGRGGGVGACGEGQEGEQDGDQGERSAQLQATPTSAPRRTLRDANSLPAAAMLAAATILRPGLLAGRAVAFAGGASEAIARACAALGASTPSLDPEHDEDALHAAAARIAPLDALVCDTRAAFATTGLRALDGAWNATRATVNAAFRPGGAGKVALLAPPPNAGAHARALRAALENLARTTSVEWARYGITTAAVLPGPATTEDELAQLAAYLVSEAGAYFSGCAFALR
jgi:hypothetical protein